MTFLLLLLLCLFVLCSGFLSATETALFSLSSMKVNTYKQHKDLRKQLIARLVLNPRDLLVTILILNIAVNIFAQNISSNLFGSYGGWALRVGVPLILTLVFGEVIPKSVAIQNNTRLAHLNAPVIERAQRLLGPVRHLVTQVGSFVSGVLFFFLKKEAEISRDELHTALSTSEKKGILHKDETELIDGYLYMQGVQVKELMRPRDEILYYNCEEPISKLIYRFVDQEVSRLPICYGDFDHVIGILAARQYFLHRHQIQSADDLRPFLKKPFFVPETATARQLFYQFEQKQEVFALVVDEYGAVTGLISREDLVEAVIGEIIDRRDEGKKLYTRAGKNEIIASGKFELSDFEDLFGIRLQSPNNMVTIGGWLTEMLGDIPLAGSKYETEQFLFQVLSAEPNRVKRVYIRFLPDQEASHD